MKKNLCYFLIFTIVFSICIIPTYAAGRVWVKVNDNPVNFPDAQPYIDKSNRTQVPISFIALKLGADVKWNGKANTVTITKGSDVIVLKIGESKATVNGQIKKFDTTCYLLHDRTYVPLAFISMTLGASVSWDKVSYTVLVKTSDTPKPQTETKGDTYKIENNRLYLLYEDEKTKEFVDAAKYSTLFTSDEIMSIFKAITDSIKGTDKYLEGCYVNKDEGNLCFNIYANKDQYDHISTWVSTAYMAISICTNGNEPYIRSLGKNFKAKIIGITSKENYLPKSNINEYINIIKNVLKVEFKTKYSEDSFNKFVSMSTNKSNNIAYDELYNKTKIGQLYQKIISWGNQYHIDLSVTEK